MSAAAEGAEAAQPGAPPEEGATPAHSALRRLLAKPSFLIGATVVLFWICCALFGALLVPYDPFATDVMHTLAPPSGAHWFGTDQLGRDIFSRVIVGARDILTVAPLATILSTVLGTTLGLTMGYFGGLFDEVFSRIVDAVLALPTIVVALLALAALGASTVTVLFVIGFTYAPIIARTVRASVLAERGLDYVAAAELRRERVGYILFAEILPNVLPAILVEATVRLGYSIFTVATLSFIGFGIQPPSPDWGLSIASSYGLIGGGFWWTVVFDGVAIASLVVGVNLLADSIQGLIND